jgi:cobalamin biosynthesis protein CobT
VRYQSLEQDLKTMAALSAQNPQTADKPKLLTPSQMAALASGLGRKNGVRVIFDNHSTACTDGKTIIIPLTSKENSWIVRGYADHEIGHVRFSDLDLAPKKPPFERSLWNIIEDVRIEKSLGDAYPGMATNLSTLVSELRRTKAGVFEVPPGSPPEAVICGYVGLTLRSLYLRQHLLADLALKARDQFLATFSPELERDLFGVITQIGSVEDTAGVVDMVRQIVALLEKHRDAADTTDSDSKTNSEEEQPGSDDQDGPNNPSQSQQIPDDLEHPESSDQSQPGSDNQDQHETSSDQQDSSEQSPYISDQLDNPEQVQDDPGSSDQSPADPDQHDHAPTDQDQSKNGPASDPTTQPLDPKGEETNASPSISDRPGQSNLDVDPTHLDSSEQTYHPGQDTPTENQVPFDAPLGLTQSQSDPTPLQEAITQALESDLEISDFGQQLKDMALESEELSGNNPRVFGIAEATPASSLPRYGYSQQPVTASSGVVAKLTANLKGLLQAQGLSRNTPSASGNRIARSRLHRIRTGEAKLFLRNASQKQVNTAIHLLLDISGSMDGRRLAIAKDVVFALVKALAHQRGINLALTLFPAFYPYNPDITNTGIVYPVAELIKHGQRPTSTLPWPGYNYGCTPLAESLIYALSTMVQLSETRKIVLLITDGEPNDSITAKTALDEAASLGIEVATIGIEGLYNVSLFPICEIVDRVEHLPQKAFKLLESLLTNKN